MKTQSILDLSSFSSSNDLWPAFVDSIGIEKATLAIRQAQDLQCMHGTKETLPVLIIETCGCALANNQLIRRYIGISPKGQGMILIYSYKNKNYQLLKDLN